MTTLVLSLIFVVGYMAIVTENQLKINKAASALLTGVLVWTLYVLLFPNHEEINHKLSEHLSDISSILFFLIGAMTIVEVVDSHHGFDIVTKIIRTTNKRKLLWIIGTLAFFLSAILDNLTTTIVMISLVRKLLSRREDRLMFAGIIVIAANAGGAWSPIGDVTTTMLWIQGQITANTIILKTFLPSLVNILVPIGITSLFIKGRIAPKEQSKSSELSNNEKTAVLITGLSALIFVPVFKTVTHLPPFMGMMLGLGVLWIVTEFIHKGKSEHTNPYSIFNILHKIDLSTILFFLGILLAVAGLQSAGILTIVSTWLSQTIQSQNVIVLAIGILSSIVDNVPLVAAAQGMYDLSQFPTDNSFWTFLAYTAGTGGSMLIIGSAAGVAAMALEKIDFFWYLRKISWLALLGYLSGAGVYMLMEIA